MNTNECPTCQAAITVPLWRCTIEPRDVADTSECLDVDELEGVVVTVWDRKHHLNIGYSSGRSVSDCWLTLGLFRMALGLFRLALGLLRVLDLLLELYFWTLAALNRLFLNFYANLCLFSSKFWHCYNTLGDFFAIFSLHMHRNGYFVHFLSKFWHRHSIQRPRFPITQSCFCDRWSFAMYIKFVTSSISRYSSTRWDTR